MFCVVLWFVRRPLSPSIEGQGLVNESKIMFRGCFVNWFFQRGKKKRLRGFVASTWGNAFVLRGVTMAGGG
jgi:hypothetical protein